MAQKWRLTDKDLERLANRHGLSYLQTKKYIIFMRERFPNEGDSNYAEEWAQRWSKDPYVYADGETTKVLDYVMTMRENQLNNELKFRKLRKLV